MTQPTMEGINTATPNSATPLDLRPSGWEADKAEAAAAKASQLDEQKNATAVSPAGMDGVTPAPASSTMPIGAEAAQPPTETKTPAFALPPEPSKTAEGSAPEAITTEGALGSSPTDAVATSQATQVAEPTKKPGFFGKLLGKK